MKNGLQSPCRFATVALAMLVVGVPLNRGADKPPAADDVAIVNKLMGQLRTAEDPQDREKAAFDLECRTQDLPLIEAAAKRDDLTPEMNMRLNMLLPRMRVRAKLQARKRDAERERDQWVGKMTADFYDRDGHTNPAWDADAKGFLALFQTGGGLETRQEHEAHQKQERALLDKAVSAGCTDPGVLALGGLLANDMGDAPDKVYDRFQQALDHCERGKVSPYIKVIIDGRVLRGRLAGYGGGLKMPNAAHSAGLMLVNMGDQCLMALKLPGIPPEAMKDMAANYFSTARQLGVVAEPNFKLVFTQLENALPNDGGVQYIKGDWYIKYGWDARGHGYADSVTPQMWKDFNDRCAIGGAALSRAYDLDPDDPRISSRMIDVLLGQSGDIDEMEKWFKRAMAADPDNIAACKAKLNFLEPKWHGDSGVLLNFGRECVRGGNWYANIPFMIAQVRAHLAVYDKDPVAYLHQPEVWAEIDSVYATHMRLYPGDIGGLNEWCVYACLCTQWHDANRLFKELGDKADPARFKGAATLKEYQQKAATLGADTAPAAP